MGNGMHFLTHQVGGQLELWDIRGYGLSRLWVMRGPTVGLNKKFDPMSDFFLATPPWPKPPWMILWSFQNGLFFGNSQNTVTPLIDTPIIFIFLHEKLFKHYETWYSYKMVFI